MIWFIIASIIALASFVPEYFLSIKKSFLPGLILPIVFFAASSVFLILNLTDAFSTVEGYGLFLTGYGSAGLFALILKVGLIYTPVLIQLVIYFICRYKIRKTPSKTSKEFKKMMADDLD